MSPHPWSLRSSAAVRAFFIGALAAAVFATHAHAQQALEKAVKGEITTLRNGPLLVHGNYCGVGSRKNAPPVDALDDACMHHDACTKTGKLPSCACDEELYLAATVIAQDPKTPPKIQVVAGAAATGMALLVCKK